MIVSLISYVLLPLSRYLTRRFPVVNGTVAWDGGAVTTKSLTQLQTTSSLGQAVELKEEQKAKRQRMKEPSQEKGGETRHNTDKGQQIPALDEETNCEVDMKTSAGQCGIKEREAEMGSQQPKDNGETENENSLPTESKSSEQALSAQLKCLQTEDSMQETTSPVQEDIQMQSAEEALTSHVTSTITEITEIWDEYVVPTADDTLDEASGSELAYTSLCSDAHDHLNLGKQHSTQAGWHFHVVPGLSEEVQCPLWQLPAVSYYPSADQSLPFEVTWRVWEELDDGANAAEAALVPFPFTEATMNFTVMSYNILAQDLVEANEELYRHSPLEVLDWNHRYALLIEEIQKWTPDILCLQEVQEDHYLEHLYPIFSQWGYTCVYKRRTGTKTDGCATCYRSSSFSEVSLTQLEFFKPETELLDRHNVGIVLLLQPVVTQSATLMAKGPHLCVANTHLLFNPRRGDVKLAQLAMVLAEIDCMVKSCKVKGEHCNVIMCGDLNSVPYMPLYQLITTGELYYHGLPSWMVSGQEDLSHKAHCHRLFPPLWPSSLGITDNCQYTGVNEMYASQSQESGKCQYSHDFMLQLRYCPAACVRPQDMKLIPGVTDNTPDASRGNEPYDKRFKRVIRHRLDLESVYQHILPVSGASEVTTLNSDVGATVDYIFYSPRRILSSHPKAGVNFVSRGLKLVGRLSLLSEDVLWGMHGLPNHIFPSDHLSLLAKFQLDLNAASQD